MPGCALRTELPLFFLLCLFAASACGRVPGVFSPTPVPTRSTQIAIYTPQPGKPGGTITFSDWYFPDNLNPLFTTLQVETNNQNLLYDPLVTINEHLKFIPDLASEVPTPENGAVQVTKDGQMTVKVKIKPNVKWSDGQDITSDDAKWSWQVLLDPKTQAATTTGYDQIQSIEISDAKTFVIHYKVPFGPYLSYLPFILPRHALQNIPREKLQSDSSNQQPKVTSGPYKISSFKKGDEIVYVPNPTYLALSNHSPYLEKVSFKCFKDPNPKEAKDKAAMIAGVKSGQTEVSEDYTEGDLKELRAIPNIEVHVGTALEYEHLDFNNARQIWKDLRVRQAIQLAIDKKQIVTAIIRGDPEQIVSTSVEPPEAIDYDPAIKSVGYDPLKAKQLLTEAGWLPGPDGILVKEGKPFIIELVSTKDNELRAQIEAQIQKELFAVGIKLTITNYEFGVLFNDFKGGGILATGKYDLALFTYLNTVDPDGNFGIFHSSQIPSANLSTGGNYARVNDSELDQDLQSGRDTLEIDKRIQFYKMFQERLIGQVYIIPLYFRANISTSSPFLHNYIQNPSLVGNTWNIADWWRTS